MVSRLDCRFVEPNGECAIHSKTTDPMEERAYAALCSVGQAELEAKLSRIESERNELLARCNDFTVDLHKKEAECAAMQSALEIASEFLHDFIEEVPEAVKAAKLCRQSLSSDARRAFLAERERERAWIRELEDLLQQIKQAITLQRSGAALNQAKKNA